MGCTRLAVMAAIAAVCGVSACGSDDDGGSDRPVALVVEASDPSEVEVELRAPASVEAGPVRMTLENQGDTLHDAQLFKVDGKRRGTEVVQEVLEAVDSAPKPAWIHPAGGVAPVRPGASATTIQVLEPGTYYIADTQERPDGRRRTNGDKGGVAKLEVTGEEGGELPKTPATITADDRDGFKATGLRPGRNRVTFRNAGGELHQLVALPVERDPSRRSDRAALEEGARAAIQRRSETAWVPVDVEGSRATTALDSGRELVTELALEPRPYVFVCFVSDRRGGVPHVYKGMASVLDLSSETERPGAGAR